MGTFTSLKDALFVSRFHPDGSARRPRECICSEVPQRDVDEHLCRTCLRDDPESPMTSDLIQDVGERLVVAAAAARLGTMSTPTTVAIPLQTAAGTPSPHIPVANASPLATAPSNSTTPLSGARKRLAEEQAAKKKVTDSQSQKRRIGKMRALQSENVAHKDTIKRQEKKIRGLTASLQR